MHANGCNIATHGRRATSDKRPTGCCAVAMRDAALRCDAIAELSTPSHWLSYEAMKTSPTVNSRAQNVFAETHSFFVFTFLYGPHPERARKPSEPSAPSLIFRSKIPRARLLTTRVPIFIGRPAASRATPRQGISQTR